MKKITLISFLLFVLIILNFNLSFSQGFNSIHTPDGVNVIAVGNNGHIFRSINGGVNWSNYTNLSVNYKSVFSINDNVWIAGDNGKIYKTYKFNSPIIEIVTGVSSSINSVYFVSDLVGFICGDLGVVYKSIDGGLSWSSSNSGITSVKLNSISFKDSQNGVVVGDGGKVFVTINGGSSWTEEISGATRNLLKAKYFSDGISITGEYGTLLLKPNDSSWTSVNTRINTDIRGVSGLGMNEIHVCGGGGFIRNNKNNSALFNNFEANPMMANLTDIFYYNATTAFAVSSLNDAIIRTADGGITWSLPASATVAYNWVSKPGASGNFLGNNLSLHPTDRNTVFIAFGNQVYRSRNRGENWSAVGNVIPAGNTPHSFFVSPIDTNIWLVATETTPDKVYRTTNYGATWTAVISKNFSSYGQPLEMDQNNPHIFYFGPDNGGFYKSTDDGATFAEISGNYPFRSPCDILVQWDNSNNIFLADGITGSGLATLFKSTNGGVNWTLVHTNASSSEIPSMTNTVFDKDLVWATEWPGSKVYRSTNNGSNFVNHHTTGFSGWGSDICKEDPTLILTGSWGAAATLSLNSGVNWTTISSGLSGHGGGILIPERGYILAHQGSNIYKLNITYTVPTVPPPPPTTTTLNLKILIEGLYYPVSNQMIRKDTVTVFIRNSEFPYSVIDTSVKVLDSVSFIGNYTFPYLPTGTYYLVVKHFNSIETWSKKGGENYPSGGTYSYDFTTSASQAFGDNLIFKGTKYCVFSGDVNQDFAIDASDISGIENDATVGLTGYSITDLNADDIVDVDDLSIVENNVSVTVVQP